MHAARFGAGHVFGQVVGEQRFVRTASGGANGQGVDLRIGLHEAYTAGEDQVIKVMQKIMTGPKMLKMCLIRIGKQHRGQL